MGLSRFLSDILSGRSLEHQLQDEARERHPHTGGTVPASTPAPDMSLAAINRRSLELLKDIKPIDVPEGFKPWTTVRQMPAGWSSGEIDGVPMFHASEADAAAMIQAARMRITNVIKVDPGVRVEDVRKAFEDARRSIRHLEPGTRHHGAKVGRMGGDLLVADPASPPTNFLIFLNGDPRSGKDTTAAFLVEAFEERGYLGDMHSSIEPVRKMVLGAGMDVSAKTERDRKFLAEMGDLTEDYCGFRSTYCVAHFLDLEKRARAEGRGCALVLHTREPSTIHKIAFACRKVSNLRVETLFISGRGVSVETNKADAGVRGMVYDTTIANSGSILELDAKCDEYVDALTRHL